MQAYIILTCAALAATAGCATPDAAAGEGATNAPLSSVETQTATNHVTDSVILSPSVSAGNDLPIMPGDCRRTPEAAVTNVAPVKIVYPDVPDDDFSVDDWAEELAEKAEQGLHIRNGRILVVARIPTIEGEHQMLAKTRAKFRAVELLRHHYTDLPKEFTAPCRVIVCEVSDSGDECVAVMSFAIKDIVKQGK